MIDFKNYYKTLCTAPINLKRSAINTAYAKFELSLYEAVLTADPENTSVLSFLGHTYTKLKMHENALIIDLKLASLTPDDPTVIFNLACSYSNMNDIENAFTALNKAVDLGYSDAEHMLKDPDLDNIRNDPRFSTIISRLKNEK